ncbi:hypothetical protein ACFQVC_08340 [Streptomyces monticola]|uniref:Uncharacterized protein n=1 Tax=Streptomyces monticola TaxID=2666263 RepID=A0ABW2JFB5_9ACTN
MSETTHPSRAPGLSDWLKARSRQFTDWCQKGQWVRWQLNYRFSSAMGIRDWWYWLDTFNIAYGPVDQDVFLSEPNALIDECGPLR